MHPGVQPGLHAGALRHLRAAPIHLPTRIVLPDFSSPWRPFLAVWRSPVLAAWAVAVFVLQLAVRLPFRHVPFVPYAMPFDPSVALIPLWLMAFGPAGLAGVAAAQVLGDALDGLPGLALGFRAWGVLLGGAWFIQMSRPWLPRSPGQPWTPPSAGAWTAFSIPMHLTLAAWGAVGLEWASWYPFVYLFPLAALHHVVLTQLIGRLMCRPALQALEGRFGLWSEAVGWTADIPRVQTARLWLLAAPLTLAVVIAGLISWFTYGLAPMQPTVLGVHGGLPVPAAASLFLGLQALALMWPDHRDPSADGGSGSASGPGPAQGEGWRSGHFTGGGVLRR